LVALGYGMTGFSNHYWPITAGIALSGLGLGLFMPNGATWLMNIVPPTVRARVIGGYSSMIFLGQFLSPLILAPVAARVTTLSSAFLFAASVAAIAALLLAFSAER
jgi:MFS family permease